MKIHYYNDRNARDGDLLGCGGSEEPATEPTTVDEAESSSAVADPSNTDPTSSEQTGKHSW